MRPVEARIWRPIDCSVGSTTISVCTLRSLWVVARTLRWRKRLMEAKNWRGIVGNLRRRCCDFRASLDPIKPLGSSSSSRGCQNFSVEPYSLLDYMAKLSDCGLAKAGPQGDETHVSTRVMGTYGYAAPEYVRWQNLKSRCA
ncbi:hypothetical protein ACS0TY_030644 [Phlomoides rotata]